jgi:hypothetical protein
MPVLSLCDTPIPVFFEHERNHSKGLANHRAGRFGLAKQQLIEPVASQGASPERRSAWFGERGIQHRTTGEKPDALHRRSCHFEK